MRKRLRHRKLIQPRTIYATIATGLTDAGVTTLLELTSRDDDHGLCELDLRDNLLTRFPGASVARALPKLRTLYLGSNRIVSFSGDNRGGAGGGHHGERSQQLQRHLEGIVLFAGLVELDLSGNKLCRVPFDLCATVAEIGGHSKTENTSENAGSGTGEDSKGGALAMPFLRTLLLHNNDIATIPLQLSRRRGQRLLSSLTLHGNPQVRHSPASRDKRRRSFFSSLEAADLAHCPY